MKRTLVAFVVAAVAATSANAVVIYEQDGANVNLGGLFSTFLGRVGDRGDLKNDGSRLLFSATQDLGNGLSGIVGSELRFEDNDGGDDAFKQNGSDSDFGSLTTREFFGGLKYEDIGTLTFGRQKTSGDAVLQDATYYRSGEYGLLTTLADKSVKFRSADWGGFSFGLDYLFGHSNKDIDKTLKTEGDKYKNGYGVTAFYHYEFADDNKLELAAGYNQDNYDNLGYTTDTVAKHRAWLVHGSYTYGPLYLALNYGQDRDSYNNLWSSQGDVKGKYAMVDFRYQFSEPSALFAQWEHKNLKYDDDFAKGENKEKSRNRYQVGIDYKFSQNVITYVMVEEERIKNTEDDEEKNHIYGVGMQVLF